MSSLREKIGLVFLITLSLLAMVLIMLQAPIPQAQSYHLFEDTRQFIGITNFFNVLSNLIFLYVGILGLIKLRLQNKLVIVNELKWAYLLLFSAISFVSLGSSYYHLTPNNFTLLWDRLPMTVAFMALFTIVIGEFISINLAKKILLPFIVMGIASVLYWYFGELNTSGDLRFYLLVQFLPVVCIPAILLCFQSKFNRKSGYWWLLLAYIIAKLFELFDEPAFSFLSAISGHSLKHIVAALGLYLLLVSFEKREKI